MKSALAIIFSLLLVVLVVAGVIVFGPFRDLLPEATRTVVDTNIPDYFSVNGRPPFSSGSSNTTLPDGTPVGGNMDKRLTLPGAVAGRTVAVLPFSTTTQTGADGLPTENHYLVVSSADIPYSIEYFSHDQSFMIGLNAEPLAQTRLEAQQTLLRMLGIGENEACNLRYAVAVPYAVNSFYVNKNLGFSFCPGATAL